MKQKYKFWKKEIKKVLKKRVIKEKIIELEKNDSPIYFWNQNILVRLK